MLKEKLKQRERAIKGNRRPNNNGVIGGGGGNANNQESAIPGSKDDKNFHVTLGYNEQSIEN